MPAAPKPEILAAFEAAKGFMPVDEGLALYAAAVEAGRLGLPLLEVGTYCGRSTILLADAARQAGVTAITVDHHRGSEEQQPGWEYHDPETVDPEIGLMDTLPTFRRTLHKAGLEEHVVALVGRSPQIAKIWNSPSAWSSSTAATPTNTPAPTTRAGHRMWPRAGCSSSTTCSPTRRTSSPARPPTASICGHSSQARSRRSPSRTRCVSCGDPGRGSDPRLKSLSCRTQVRASSRPTPSFPSPSADRRGRRAGAGGAAGLARLRGGGRTG